MSTPANPSEQPLPPRELIDRMAAVMQVNADREKLEETLRSEQASLAEAKIARRLHRYGGVDLEEDELSTWIARSERRIGELKRMLVELLETEQAIPADPPSSLELVTEGEAP